MTQLKKRAFDKAPQGHQALQESDQRWDDSFDRSQNALLVLAEEALAEHRAGRSEPLDPDTL